MWTEISFFSKKVFMENPIYFAQCEELHHQGATPLLGAGQPSQWCSNASLARRHLQIMLMTSCTLAIVLPHSLTGCSPEQVEHVLQAIGPEHCVQQADLEERRR